MPTPPADAEAEPIVDQVVTTATYEAASDVANQLIGLLWHDQQVATDPAEAEALQVERREVRARQRTLRPGSDEVTAALQEWGARVRALRER